MDNCPTCGSKYVAQCRCMVSDRICGNGHHWHRCPAHKTIVLASFHDTPPAADGCTCLAGALKVWLPSAQKYHPVQPRTSAGSWTLPSGENHPMSGGEVTLRETDHYVDASFSRIKTVDMGPGVEPLKIKEHVATVSGYKSEADSSMVLMGLNVTPGAQRKGIGSAMLAELGNTALAKSMKYTTTNLLPPSGEKFMGSLSKRGLASPRDDLKGAYWLDAEKLTTKYQRG